MRKKENDFRAQVLKQAEEITGPRPKTRRVNEEVVITFAKDNPLQEQFEKGVMPLFNVDRHTLKDMRNEYSKTIIYTFAMETEVRDSEIPARARQRMRETEEMTSLTQLITQCQGTYQFRGAAPRFLQ